ncbi:MAG: SH3 domain-containing protein [Rhizobiaceae bacterium]
MRHTVPFLAVMMAFAAAEASACGGAPVCTVVDPTGTPLNVRDGPNGRILSTLNRGAVVEFIEHRDQAGSRWALVSRYAEAWGWVFGAYLTCNGKDELGPFCTVSDPTGTPLNVREEPNGKILGTWQNGVRVRPYDEKTHNGKLWYAVERLAEDNAEGWVFDAYLKCEEDSH